MKPNAIELSALLHNNRNVVAAWFDDPDNPQVVEICYDTRNVGDQPKLPASFKGLTVHVRVMRPFAPLICPPGWPSIFNQNQACQDEPIKLGCQIQPQGANWLGTAGSPCKWLDADDNLVYGFLSNWHVMASGDERVGRTQHQPDTSKPSIATLTDWSRVVPEPQNYVDAAIANAMVDGFHTISPNIIGIGPIGDHPIRATVGLRVSKSGRTTGPTYGVCTAVGAAVRVGYGDFEATFTDQDVYSGIAGTFSAPGDSGSMILGETCKCPASLLFAGNALLTIGNPIRYVNEAMGLIYPFP